MPFARIMVREGWSDADLQTLSDTLHEVLVAEFSVPPTDRFHIIESLPAARFIYDRHYLSKGRSDRYVLFSLVAGKSRSTEQKRTFYRVLSERLRQRLDLDPSDVMVVIQQTSAEEWSFSGGEMFDLSMIK